MGNQPLIDKLRATTRAHFPQLTDDLADLVRIPGVSMDAFDQTVLDKSAAAVAKLLEDAAGVPVEIVHLPADKDAGHGAGRPALLAEIPASKGQPTVMLYAHHDVQPAGDASQWTTTKDPFEPVVIDDRMYGRGTADDKAGVIAHIGVLRVLREAGLLNVGVRIFIEGEEEIGSPTFRPFLDTYRDRLDADAIIVADSNNWRVGTPALTTSLRGVVGANVTLSVLPFGLHSGMFGGPIIDAVTLMARLISTLHNEDGSVAIAGLESYEHGGVDYAEADYRKDTGLLDGVELCIAEGSNISSHLWTKPAVAVTGMDVTPVDAASNTIIPSVRAKLSVRVAPGQDPREVSEALLRHLRENTPMGAQLEIEIEEEGPSFRADMDAPAMADAKWALATAFQTDPVDIGVGGSIPFIAELQDVFPKAQILVTGVEDPDSRPHSTDESVHLGDLENVILAEALLLARLGGLV